MKFLKSFIRLFVIKIYYYVYAYFYKMDLHHSVMFSLSSHFDKVNPRGVHIGAFTFIAKGAIVLSHDFTRSLYIDTYIGSNSFVGVNSVVMPGVKIGNNCVIGACSLVTKDVPDNSLAFGVPARVVRQIHTTDYGKIID